MSKKVNTTTSVKKNAKTTETDLANQVKSAAKLLKEEKQVEVTIPKLLEPRLGANVPVALNGAVIHVPVGKKVKIPESMAKILNDSIAQIR